MERTRGGGRTVRAEAIASVDRAGPHVAPRRGRPAAHQERVEVFLSLHLLILLVALALAAGVHAGAQVERVVLVRV